MAMALGLAFLAVALVLAFSGSANADSLFNFNINFVVIEPGEIPELLVPPIPTARNVLCVYNQNSQLSSAICDYYLLKRPGAKKFGLGIPDSAFLDQKKELMSNTNFIKLVLRPLKSFVNSGPDLKISHLAVAKDMPTKVKEDYRILSANPILTMDADWGSGETFSEIIQKQGGGTVLDFLKFDNTYQRKFIHFSPDDYRKGNYTWGYRFAVSYLTGYTLEDIKKMIDKASASASSLSGAKWLLDRDEDSFSVNEAEVLFAEAALLGNKIPQQNIVIERTNAKPVVVSGEIAGYFGPGIHHQNYSERWMDTDPSINAGVANRAILTSYESFNAVSFAANPVAGEGRAGQGLLADAFSPNAFGGTNYSRSFSGAVGNVDEPGLQNVMFANDLFGAYSGGLTLGESFLASIKDKTERYGGIIDFPAIFSKNIAVGDPLMRVTDSAQNLKPNGAECSSANECSSGNCDPDNAGAKKCHFVQNACPTNDTQTIITGNAAYHASGFYTEIQNGDGACVNSNTLKVCNNSNFQIQQSCPANFECSRKFEAPAYLTLSRCRLKNGQICNSASECNGGSCSADITGTKRCHQDYPPEGRCVINATGEETDNGLFACIDDNRKQKCSNGSWSAMETCPAGCQNGLCVGGHAEGNNKWALKAGITYPLTLPVIPPSRSLNDLFKNAPNSSKIFFYRNNSHQTATALFGRWNDNSVEPGEGFLIKPGADYSVQFDGSTIEQPVPVKIDGNSSLIGLPACGEKYKASEALAEIIRIEPSCNAVSLVPNRSGPTYYWSEIKNIPTMTKKDFKMDNYSAYFVLCEKEVNFTWTPQCNLAPTVSVARPLNGAVFTTGQQIAIEANASDDDGRIAKIEFYNGGTKIAEDANPPYTATFGPTAAGTYILSAKATDNKNTATTSIPITITVNEAQNTPPTATLTNPQNNTIFTKPTTITITANATDPDGTITKVEFFDGPNLLGQDTTTPYTFEWTDQPTGTRTIRAKATDNKNTATFSDPITITVNEPPNQPPTVTTTNPQNNSSFTKPATINITANATDPDGTITKVEFYDGTNLLGQDTTTPYTFTWNNPTTGTHTLTTKATDNDTATTTSTPITITVNEPPNQPPTVTTTNPQNNSSFTKPATINITANATDPDGTITKVEFYDGTNLLGQDTTTPYTFTWNNPTTGTHTLTTKATDNDTATTTSTPITITVNEPPNQPPTVTITNPQNNSSFTKPATISIIASAADTDGNIAKVEFYDGQNLFAQDTNSPYTATLANPATGVHSITAKAKDELNAAATSLPITLTVLDPQNAAPSVAVTKPDNNAGFKAGNKVEIEAAAEDPDGTIAKVEFFANTTKICDDDTGPYNCRWENAPAGAYIITAKATDGNGAFATSAQVRITVEARGRTEFRTQDLNLSESAGATRFNDSNTGKKLLEVKNIHGNDAKLGQMAVKRSDENDTRSFMIISGLALDQNQTKTIYLERRDPTANGVCIRDTNGIASMEEILQRCTSIKCPGSDQNYTCTIDGDFFAVSGLRNTGVIETTVANRLPLVRIVYPQDGTNFVYPQAIYINVESSDADGNVMKVELYNGNEGLGRDVSAPYSFKIKKPLSGTYILFAKAFDNDGNYSVSDPVKITVNGAQTEKPPEEPAPEQPAGKASIDSFEIGPATTGEPSQIVAVISHSMASTQSFLIEARIIGNGVQFSTTETANNVRKGLPKRVAFSNYWIPEKRGKYVLSLALYTPDRTERLDVSARTFEVIGSPAETRHAEPPPAQQPIVQEPGQKTPEKPAEKLPEKGLPQPAPEQPANIEEKTPAGVFSSYILIGIGAIIGLTLLIYGAGMLSKRGAI